MCDTIPKREKFCREEHRSTAPRNNKTHNSSNDDYDVRCTSRREKLGGNRKSVFVYVSLPRFDLHKRKKIAPFPRMPPIRSAVQTLSPRRRKLFASLCHSRQRDVYFPLALILTYAKQEAQNERMYRHSWMTELTRPLESSARRP